MRWTGVSQASENTIAETVFPKPDVGLITEGEGIDREEKGAHDRALGTEEFVS